jgi:hypothetical protein
VQLLERHFLTEIDSVCETLSAKASVALDDNAIQSQKYTSIGRFQLFLNVFVPRPVFGAIGECLGGSWHPWR